MTLLLLVPEPDHSQESLNQPDNDSITSRSRLPPGPQKILEPHPTPLYDTGRFRIPNEINALDLHDNIATVRELAAPEVQDSVHVDENAPVTPASQGSLSRALDAINRLSKDLGIDPIESTEALVASSTIGTDQTPILESITTRENYIRAIENGEVSSAEETAFQQKLAESYDALLPEFENLLQRVLGDLDTPSDAELALMLSEITLSSAADSMLFQKRLEAIDAEEQQFVRAMSDQAMMEFLKP